MNSSIREGIRIARAVTRRHARTFYFASHFLPRRAQDAAYCIYALCRQSDDTVDAHRPQAAQRLALIEERIAQAYAAGMIADPLLQAFRETLREYDIPRDLFAELIAGMRMDLTETRYPDFARLYRYCYRVAGIVGLIMLRIFRVRDPAAQEPAVQLGVAMQLTNILRDLKEDLALGRIYLPQDECARFGVTEEMLARGAVTGPLRSLLTFQIARARDYYRGSVPGFGRIPDKRCRLTARTMARLYAGILEEIERADYDVFSRRAHVSGARKILLATRTFFVGGFPS